MMWTLGFAVNDVLLAICNPSLLPGGVSSAAEADAEAEALAEIDSLRLGVYPYCEEFPANGFDMVEVIELAEAENDGFW